MVVGKTLHMRTCPADGSARSGAPSQSLARRRLAGGYSMRSGKYVTPVQQGIQAGRQLNGSSGGEPKTWRHGAVNQTGIRAVVQNRAGEQSGRTAARGEACA